jgi:hypothetical protein
VLRAVQRSGQFVGLYAVASLVAPGTLAQVPDSLLNDNQFWGAVQVSAPVRKKVDLVLGGTLRLGDDLSRLVYERGSAGLLFKLGEHVTLAPIYGYIATQVVPQLDVRENRFSLDTAVSFPLERFTFTDHNILDRRFVGPTHFSRYRNMLQISRVVKLREVTLLLFVADEIAYEWRVDALTRNRFSIGGGKSLSKKVSIDLFYLRQNGAYARPRDINAIGTTLRIRF